MKTRIEPNEAAERAAAAERQSAGAGAVATAAWLPPPVRAARAAKQSAEIVPAQRKVSRAWPDRDLDRCTSSQRTAAIGAEFCAWHCSRAALGAVHALAAPSRRRSSTEFRARCVRGVTTCASIAAGAAARAGSGPRPDPRRDFVRRFGRRRTPSPPTIPPSPIPIPRAAAPCHRRPPLPHRFP